MTGINTVTVRESGKKPDFKKTAAELLERCRAFYQDPENEQAFQKWKAGKGEKSGTVLLWDRCG